LTRNSFATYDDGFEKSKVILFEGSVATLVASSEVICVVNERQSIKDLQQNLV
jgi:hypothetical protein